MGVVVEDEDKKGEEDDGILPEDARDQGRLSDEWSRDGDGWDDCVVEELSYDKGDRTRVT